MIRLATPEEPTEHPIMDVLSSIRDLGPLSSYLGPLYRPVREYYCDKLTRLISEHVPCETSEGSKRASACEKGASFLLLKKIGKCGIIRNSRRVLIPEAYQLALENFPAWQPIDLTFVYSFLTGASEFHRLILCLLKLDDEQRARLFSRARHSHDYETLDKYLGHSAWLTLKDNVLHLPRPLCQAMR